MAFRYILLCLIVFYFVNSSLPHIRNYEGYTILTITPRNKRELKYLSTLEKPEYDFWGEPCGIGFPVDLMVPPKAVREVEKHLKKRSIDYFVKVPNLQEAIDAYSTENRRRRSPVGGNWAEFFNDFREMQDIYGFMNHIVTSFPEIVSLDTIGKSYENLPLKVLVIGRKPNLKKPIIWIDGGIHGREWISPSSTLYIAHELANGYGKVAEVTMLVNHFEWHILPVANPDGYEFSRTKDHMWRKNRRPFSGNGIQGIGVDLNRNYPYKWNGTYNDAASDVNSPVFAGSNPRSESEVEAVIHYLSNYRSRVSAFLTIHSFKKALLYPWSHTTVESRYYKDLRDLGKKVVAEVKRVTGQSYKSKRSSYSVTNLAYGTAMDWAHGSLGIRYSYTFELRDYNNTGFFVPPTQILPIGKEAWNGVKMMGILLKVKH